MSGGILLRQLPTHGQIGQKGIIPGCCISHLVAQFKRPWIKEYLDRHLLLPLTNLLYYDHCHGDRQDIDVLECSKKCNTFKYPQYNYSNF